MPETGHLRILDAGGGNGLDSLPFLEEGARVALVDFSEKMLSDAERRAKDLGVADHLSIHLQRVEAVPDLFQPESHDVVLLHSPLCQYRVRHLPSVVY